MSQAISQLKRKNSFDFVRFLAASLVVLSHSFALVGLAEPRVGDTTLGRIAVWVFFLLSGYLISASWYQYPRFNVFLAKRMLRIFPGLIVAVILTVVICGLFYTNKSLGLYLISPLTFSYINNVLLINIHYLLPGVFEHNIYPHIVNGSLWTLAYEFLMYIFVGLLGALGIYRIISISKIWVGLLLLQLIMCLVGVNHFAFNFVYFNFSDLVVFGLMFFTGVLIQKRPKLIKFDSRYGFGTLLLYIILVSLLPRFTEVITATLLAYSLFSLGVSAKMNWFGRYGDFSYGIYIYSFVIQQMVVASTKISNPYGLFAVAWPLSIMVGAASWWLVESKMLKLKSKINLKKYPLLQTEIAW